MTEEQMKKMLEVLLADILRSIEYSDEVVVPMIIKDSFDTVFFGKRDVLVYDSNGQHTEELTYADAFVVQDDRVCMLIEA